MWKCSGALLSHVTQNTLCIIHDDDDNDDDFDYDDEYVDDEEDEHKQQHPVKIMIMWWHANISNKLFDQKSPDHPMVRWSNHFSHK